uniref:(northern house mosquito) hypothetical protein n=1 Tax=Culex pipiens TaxID=7175 RepID=A0A8D8ANR8_CULPI
MALPLVVVLDEVDRIGDDLSLLHLLVADGTLGLEDSCKWFVGGRFSLYSDDASRSLALVIDCVEPADRRSWRDSACWKRCSSDPIRFAEHFLQRGGRCLTRRWP